MKLKAWAKKRKWDILFMAFIGLLFIPSIRMVVMSSIQRLFAGAPSELSKEEQIEVNSFDWVLLDMEGKQSNFSSAKGKVTIVNLWATWCPPCVAEMPSLQKLYNHFGDDLAFFFISNEKPEKLNQFLEEKQYDFPVYVPLSNYPKEFDSNSLPTTYLLDQNGKIIMEEVGAHDWYSENVLKKIKELNN
ncbi:TlpA family protein disulfide reductase [Brumimicrobium aurantiacum]|uniref:TlpA family protein disulfide reductase n=1 Tax=Brumimicrobium aurantiacum TaxID=1737063 RepID=A0A3E1EYK0_9FLAO|nr:TlpA disulfide reductase family protein [Brumimicrobium aurantiacum]RFC54553.1 TlpA family protein disulfide reductase [Brumimicrobium aurantiacum]